MMNLKKIFFLCPKELYNMIAVKTHGFKEVDGIFCELVIKNLLSEDERSKLEHEGVIEITTNEGGSLQ